ncbi:MAG: SprB repeat-containing protein, partial [Chitinophagales bacterium]|nr:SprB repeat-containing protein [Chitinophagales bacterium]
MKKISSLCYCLLLASAIFSQNLVVNPSFEITNTNCANFGGEGFRQDLSPSWDNANSNAQGDSCSSPDLFSSCNIAFTNMPGGGMGALGFQYSRTGTRHAGFITYDALGSTYREYIQGRTSAPLVAGQKYCVSMYVSLADLVPYATNNIGVYFSNTQYMRDACTQGALINVTPQLNYGCGAITDTSENWVRLQWDYTATGGEQYFIIGNFFNNAGTVIQNTGVSPFPHTFAYYFIDDVSIVPNTCCFADVPSTASFCIFDAASNLTATTGTGTVCNANISGTWSGPGITNPSTGTFDPSVAGIGTHLVTFTLSCGFVDTVMVSVNSCTAVSVCKETNGNLTVSGGNPVYTWSYWQAATSTPITTQAQCVACGGSWLPFGGTCLAGVTPLTSCNTPAQWVQFATGVSVAPPAGKDTIRVVDNAGTTVVMNGLSTVQPCTQCATITVSVQSKQDVTCATPNSGSATFSATGATGTVTYTWSPSTGSTSATASGLAAGTYNVTVTDGNSCTGTGSVTIAAPAAPSLVLSNPVNPGCGQNNGSVSAT